MPLFKISSAEFRRTSSDDMWHFCASCARWPIDAYVACVKVAGDCAVCTEWIVEYERGFLASPRQATTGLENELKGMVQRACVKVAGKCAGWYLTMYCPCASESRRLALLSVTISCGTRLGS